MEKSNPAECQMHLNLRWAHPHLPTEVNLDNLHINFATKIGGRTGVGTLTDISEVDQTVLADVGAGAGLWSHNGAGAALFIADDAKLR